jgi:chromatin remodeling complex protein RSC6
VDRELRALEPSQGTRGTARHERIGVFQRAKQEREVIVPPGAAVLREEDFLEQLTPCPLRFGVGLEPQKGDCEEKSGSHQARSERDSRPIRGKNRFFPIVFIEKMLNFSPRQFFVPPPQSTFGPLTGDVSMAKKKKAAKKPAKKKVAKKTAKRKPSAAFMKPMQPSAALSEVVGSKPIPRTEVTKKLWAYIKRKGLQDKKNRRNINGDAALKAVFGGKATVNMFEMTKLVNKHLK